MIVTFITGFTILFRILRIARSNPAEIIKLVDESVELVKVHEDGSIELVMKYGDIYALTVQSIKEVQGKTAESRQLQDKKPSEMALYPEKQQSDCPAVFKW